MHSNFHNGSSYVYVGDKDPNADGIVHVGSLYMKVDKGYCFNERPWFMEDGRLVPEGEVVRVAAMSGPNMGTDFLVDPDSTDSIYLRHSPFNDEKAESSVGWRSWFLHCFKPLEDVIQFESVEAPQIGPAT